MENDWGYAIQQELEDLERIIANGSCSEAAESLGESLPALTTMT